MDDIKEGERNKEDQGIGEKNKVIGKITQNFKF
jgi:hypothetical protein